MIANIEFALDAAMDADEKTLATADAILDEILHHGMKLCQMKMPRGVTVYVKGRYDIIGRELK